MRALVQRVESASVTVDGIDGAPEVTGAIDHGMCVLVGVTHSDTEAEADKVADKLAGLRIFDDDDGVMNRSVVDTAGSILIVSQFTLYGDTRKGRRPSWIDAARPEQAEPLIEAVIARLRAVYIHVETGRFRTDMKVALVNDGPITVTIEV